MTDRERFIIFLDNEEPSLSDAIIMLEGDGFSRIEKTVELYKKGYAPKVVFSGNIENKNYGSYPYSEIKPILLEKGILEKDLIWESISTNTYEQAVQILRIALENNWKKIILVASHYHSYRAFLTFLSVIKKNNSDLILYSDSAKNLSWEEDTGYGKRIDLIEGEFSRIEQYQQKGDVATFEEGVKYQLWKQKLN